MLKSPFARSETLSLLGRLLGENFRKHALSYATAFVLLAIISSTTAATAWLMKDVVNDIFVDQNAAMVAPLAIAVLILFGTKGACGYGQGVILSRVGNRIVADTQTKIYDKVVNQHIPFFETTSSSNLITRVTVHAQAVRTVINQVVLGVGRDALTVVGLVAVMVLQDPVLAALALVVLPVVVIGISILTRRIKDVVKQELFAIQKVIERMQQTAQGIQVIKSFRLERDMTGKMDDAIQSVRRRANSIATVSAASIPLTDTMGGVAVAAVLLYGGYSVAVAGNDPGSFFAFIAALLMASDPARRLAQLRVQMEPGLIATRLMYELVDMPDTQVDRADATPLENVRGRIEFDDVYFHYNKEAPVLKGFSFVAQPGETVAFVGPSGGGKSTVFSLLQRFYEPHKGHILIEGHSIQDTTYASLRDTVSFVGQNVYLFEGSVRDNIAVGRQEATHDEIENAARFANAHDFILALPDGYDTEVGELGGRLSGGQRQRIAIARAVLKDAPILLLDEATSALDADSERAVQEALTKLMTGRTSLVIAHRLSTVVHADIINVVLDGRIVETGRHAELLAKGGYYSHVHKLQMTGDGLETTETFLSEEDFADAS